MLAYNSYIRKIRITKDIEKNLKMSKSFQEKLCDKGINQDIALISFYRVYF